MRTINRNSIKLLLLVTLALCLPCLPSCAHPQTTIVIPADKTIKSLPNGNYEVTPAWLQDRYNYERWVKEQMEKCQGGQKK